MVTRSSILLLCTLLVSAGPAAAQKQQESAATVVQRTIPVPASGFIRIFQLTGSVRVEGWDRDSVALNGTVIVPAAGEFVVTPGKQGAKISLWGPDETQAPPSQLVVRVPRRSQLWIKTQSANVEVADFEGSLDIVTIAGQTQVSGRPREVYIESMGGSVTLALDTRSARIKTGTGAVTLRGNIQDLTVSSVSGAVTVQDVQLRQAHFESVDGPIRFLGALNEPAALEFINHSGDIELALTPGSMADFRVTTVSGAFRDEWGIRPASTTVNTRGASTKLGGKEFGFLVGGEGVADISIRNFKGAVILRRLPARMP